MPEHQPPESHPHPAKIDRRTFLVRSALAGATVTGALAVGWRLRHLPEKVYWDEGAFAPPGEARVAVLSAATYDSGLEQLVLEGLREVGADVHGARVLLKPNLVEFDAGTAVNTDPRLIAAAIAAFRRLGAASVVVGEGPGHRRDTRYLVEASGLGDVVRDAGVPFVDLNTDAVDRIALNSWYTDLREIWLPRSITHADVVVSMPKMKTHHWVGLTLSLKNCFGCLPGRVYGWPKNALHWAGVEGSILDVAGAVRPDLAIVDGIVGMEGNGPINGIPKPVGLIVVGNDPVAADVVTAGIMGIDATKIPYLAEASRYLGQGDLERILQVGEDPSGEVTPFVPAPGFGTVGSESA